MTPSPDIKPKGRNLVRIALIGFLVLFGLKTALDLMNKKMGSENIHSVSMLKNDDSTYKYVKQKCEEGSFPPEHENCKNMRLARP